VGSITSLDAVARRKIPAPAINRTPIAQPVTILTELPLLMLLLLGVMKKKFDVSSTQLARVK
jgi:hypothetical protein